MRATSVRQAVVLAGGLGSRLGELAAAAPKPLLTCGDRPFLAWLLRDLSRFGVEEVILLTGHLADVVEARLPMIAASLPKTMRVICSREERPAGTGGALFNAREHLADRFLLCNGDSWQDFNVARLLADAAHDRAETIGRIVLRHLANGTRYGVVETEGDRITAFHERGQPGKPAQINAGLYHFDRRVLDEATPVCSLERDIMPRLASRGALRATLADGYFIDIGLPSELQRAQTELPARQLRRALFLNWDHIINFDGRPIGKRERVSFVPGALTAIRAASDAGWHVFIAADHFSEAQGLYKESQFASLCTWVIDAIRAEGGTIDDLGYCPSHPQGRIKTYLCCGKLMRESLRELLARWQLNPAQCLLICNRRVDLVAAATTGVRAHLYPIASDLAKFVVPLLNRTPAG